MLKELLGNCHPRVGLALTYLLLAEEPRVIRRTEILESDRPGFESWFCHFYQ